MLHISNRIRIATVYQCNLCTGSLKNLPKPRYWDDENIMDFLLKIKCKYNFKTPQDWNSMSNKHFKSNGGITLLSKYSMFELKCMACPEGKSIFNIPNKPPGYWEKKENILEFLSEIKKKYNLNTPEDWNSITQKQIRSNGGNRLLSKYSIFEIKCMACPEGKSIFDKPFKSPRYWENNDNIINFLATIKQKYNFQTPDDWNSMTKKQIISNGGSRLLSKYSIFELKCMACPEGKSVFDNPYKSSKYWENNENILEFLSTLKQKYNLQTPEDWNSITTTQTKANGGSGLLLKYNIFELKCMACPEGKSIFYNPTKPPGYWDSRENVLKFLLEIKEKYNFTTPLDWNSMSTTQIMSNGGYVLLSKYSIFELKCMACPEGKLMFDFSNKPLKHWEKKENILEFLSYLKQKYNLQTPDDWNSITKHQIRSNGGSTLFPTYSLFELKCMACPEGKFIFNNPIETKSLDYWDDDTNKKLFIDKLKKKYHLHTPSDWKRLSMMQIISQGGSWIFKCDNLDYQIAFESNNEQTFIPLKELISVTIRKRASQRWLFLQIQKLFPGEEIIEDFYHPELSRINGTTIEFDVFLSNRKIAIEYHGKHHYEDIPSGFSSLELYQSRDVEKEKLCKDHGIHLIVIPYWWDNSLTSLRNTLLSNKVTNIN